MQRALSSIVRRSLLQRTARSAASPAALLIKASTSSSIQAYRQFSVSTLRFQDGESVFSGSALGGENAASDRPARGQRPDAKLGLFVGGLDPNTRDEDLIRAFSHFGEVTEANVVMDRDTQRSKRFGFVYFKDQAPVEKILSGEDQLEHLAELGVAPGIERITRPASSSRERSAPGERRPFDNSQFQEPSDTIFLTGFPRTMTRAEIEECLTEFYPSSGIVKDFRVPVNRIERMQESREGDQELHNKGFAFIRLGNEEEAKELLDALNDAARNGFVFPGAERPPVFRYASPQKPGLGGQGAPRDGSRGGFGSFGGNSDRRGGGSRFGGDRRERRPSGNSWLNEERSRFQGGRGDEY
ncbi:hypothetical protein P389DRAFT_62206 [Cystobasidium minutum MCA 4210]|uniref:uncharacterized protein n=1 Tax=Cystobasidium minutum MCA 4210 TaxID=1397322 RepID=UPI0034CDD0A7|eukprot:jgi/Rhomi1/62206/CE62205_1324